MSRHVLIRGMLFCLILFPAAVQAQGFTQQDRDLLVTLSVRMDEMDKRMIELREDMNKRFEQVDKRFEQVNSQFEQLTSFLWMIVGVFTTLAVANIGLVLWDRRSMVRPFEIKMNGVEKEIAGNADLLKRLLDSLRALALEDPKVANVLRQFHLL